jgi:hypothetical protein
MIAENLIDRTPQFLALFYLVLMQAVSEPIRRRRYAIDRKIVTVNEEASCRSRTTLNL